MNPASDPRVVIVAREDSAAGPIAHGLDALGWRTITARSADAAVAAISDFGVEAVIVDGPSDELVSIEALKAAAAPRSLPVVKIRARGGGDGADLAMSQAPHPVQLALRLEQLLRAAVAEEEVTLRRATFALRRAPIEPPVDERPLRVLAAGPADHRFIGLFNALQAHGAELVAAPTPYTAFDYMHESAFDAVLLWAADDAAPALSIASGMKRNTRLYHIPLVLYLRSAAELNLSETYHRGVADVVTADTPEEETARRILALAQGYRRHQSLRRALEGVRGSEMMDPGTGLFTADLFASHLARIVDGAVLKRRDLSVAVLRVQSNDELTRARLGGWLDRAMPQIGSMVSRLVRAEDTAARLGSEVFALAMPATPLEAGRLAADRIGAVIGCTAFDAGPDQTPFVVGFDIGCAELRPGETPAGLLERAYADLRERR